MRAINPNVFHDSDIINIDFSQLGKFNPTDRTANDQSNGNIPSIRILADDIPGSSNSLGFDHHANSKLSTIHQSMRYSKLNEASFQHNPRILRKECSKQEIREYEYFKADPLLKFVFRNREKMSKTPSHN